MFVDATIHGGYKEKKSHRWGLWFMGGGSIQGHNYMNINIINISYNWSNIKLQSALICNINIINIHINTDHNYNEYASTLIVININIYN